MFSGATGEASPGAGSSGRSTWWARRDPETPLAEKTECSKVQCTKSTASPFDLYCREGDSANPNEFHFVVLGASQRLQTAGVYCARALLGLLALLAAESGSPVPLDIAAGLAGLLLLVLPLRQFRASRLVAAVGWTCSLAVVLAARETWLGSSDEDVVQAVVVIAAALALVVAVVAYRDAEPSADLLHRGVATALSLAVAAALLFVAFELGVGEASSSISRALLLICILAVGGVAVGTALTGFLVAFESVNIEDVKPRRARRYAEPRFRHRPDPPAFAVATPLSRAVHVGLVAMTRTVNRCVDALGYSVRIVVRAVNAIAHAWAWAEFSIRRLAIWACRLIGRATLDALSALRLAMLVVAVVARRWMESTVLGVALFIVAAELTVTTCSLFASYLKGGDLLEGVGGIALALPVTGALVLTWWTLTKWPALHVARSALHTVEGAGPSLFLTLVALGWVDGVVGILGFGPIRPGVLTIGGTALLVVSTGYLLLKERRGQPEPSGNAA